ncbi:hypothetical protein ADK60_37060 [Streptomyces sp. XY431]|uniref:DUF5988 family protein n=1 Tax=Streptomyces sp. XY431 TaxID=1415562 RepID=UPI0006AE9AB5|nr:DUF5988 family protein [Streptomyces sp. XY431]KOV10753.1 hypothetical protein ADK60_37060 [Streptomyces sp. XY431]
MDAQEMVFLEGGPEGVPCTCQISDLALADSGRAVVSYCGCNEHYESTGEMEKVAGQFLPVFRWSYSTRIAE